MNLWKSKDNLFPRDESDSLLELLIRDYNKFPLIKSIFPSNIQLLRTNFNICLLEKAMMENLFTFLVLSLVPCTPEMEKVGGRGKDNFLNCYVRMHMYQV